jgi:CheY-like chemotaxis protein
LAADGQEGLRAASKEPPDLILMDLSLPEIDGWELARRLKSNPETRGIPILALTAHAMGEDLEKALAAGCDDYDSKPVAFDQLLEKMDRLLHRGAIGPTMCCNEERTS